VPTPIHPRLLLGIATLLALAACSRPPPQSDAQGPTALPVETPPPAATLEPRFNPTAAIGLGVNVSAALTPDDLAPAFAAVPQSGQMRFTATASPPGTRGADVLSVSVRAEDTAGVLRGMDATGRRMLGDALLTAAGTAWPRARVSLLVIAADGAPGQIIGSRPPGGPNSVIVA
jgi:hypothetical protein